MLQILHRDLGVKSFMSLEKRLLRTIVSFSHTYFSQGGVATQLGCGRISNKHFIAYFSAKKLKIGQHLAKK